MHDLLKTHRVFRWLSIWCLALFVMACANTPPRPVNQDDLKEIKPAQSLELEKQNLASRPAPIVEKKPQEPSVIELPSRFYSMTFQNASLGEVLAALTKDSDYNLVVEADIDLARSITVRLNKVSLNEALEMIVVNGAGYAWSISEAVLRIQRFTERVYQLDHLDLSGETSIEIGGDLLASGTNSTSVSGKYQVKSKRPEQGSDLWTALVETLEGLKSPEGILRINRNSGVIYMADSPRKVASMVRFLDSISESMHRQVFIEAKIMEVILKDDQKTGIDWKKLNIQFTSGSSILPDIFTIDFNSDGQLAKSNVSRFSAVLDFLRTQGDVTVLANPQISVINRQSAVLTVGSQFPYSDIDGVDRNFEAGFVSVNTTIKRALLGIQLGITPLISSNGAVTLNIVPSLTRIQREVPIQIPTAGIAANQTIMNPVIDLQELVTTVRVKTGQTVVLAGLITKTRKINDEGLPFLGNLPFLGRFFKHADSSEETAELVILITPYIKEKV
jgi:MSHA type pilus biogenesis protein MshL